MSNELDFINNGSEATQFKQGNEAWRAALGKSGAKKRIATPERFIELFFEYCQTLQSWEKNDFRGKEAEEVILKFKVPLTWHGFDNYVFEKGIISNLEDYRLNTGRQYDEFIEVVKRVNTYIYDNKFTGGAIGFFNAGLISRDLALAELKEVTHKGAVIDLGGGVRPPDEDEIENINEEEDEKPQIE